MPDVEIDILANDKTGRGTNSAASNFDKLNARTKKAVKEIESLPLGSIGGKAGTDFASGFLKPLSAIAGQLTPVLAGAAIASAPFIGAAISGAIIGGAGLGGVAGGLLIASRDARVQAAANGLGERLESRLEQAAGSFVQPAIDGLGRIEQAVDSIDLEGIFADSARFVAPLAEGASAAIKRLGEGFESLVDNAGPVIDAIAKGVGDLGDAAADVFESLSDNGTEAAIAINQAFKLLEGAIRAVGVTVNALTEAYGFLAKTGLLGQDLQREWYRLDAAAKNAEASVNGAAGGIQKAGESADEAAPPVKSLSEQMADAADAAADLFDSATDVGGALDRASKAAKENGKTLSANTEKGRENRAALSGVAKALRSNYEQYVAVNGAGGKAEKVADNNRAAFIRAARGFGLSASAARDLANKILGIPAKKSTKSVFDRAASSADIAAYKKQIAGIPTYKRTTVEIAAKITGSSASRSALNSALNKQSLKFDALGSFAATGGDTTSRTGGATPVNVSNTIRVDLDGAPFYDLTARAVREDRKREQFRAKVGQKWQ